MKHVVSQIILLIIPNKAAYTQPPVPFGVSPIEATMMTYLTQNSV